MALNQSIPFSLQLKPLRKLSRLILPATRIQANQKRRIPLNSKALPKYIYLFPSTDGRPLQQRLKR